MASLIAGKIKEIALYCNRNAAPHPAAGKPSFLIAAFLIDMLEKYWIDVRGAEIRRMRGLSLYLACLIVFIALFAAGDSASFIYFRF